MTAIVALTDADLKHVANGLLSERKTLARLSVQCARNAEADPQGADFMRQSAARCAEGVAEIDRLIVKLPDWVKAWWAGEVAS
jgi:hypothetical protein